MSHIASLFGGNTSQEVSHQIEDMLTKYTRIITGDHNTVISKKTINLLEIFNFNDSVFIFNVHALFLIFKSTDYVDSPYFKIVCDDNFYDNRSD